ncbi:bifunctional biotin--[acetyl-CoA-carboxylase] ligase/biotin operon repressor BirA [Pseudomonas sp. M30-35]|uniref:bifunctional biotin--[acetyl-CoA-carboxylase] ligase/biotin operon repressor BirA n=1 Tax=Pseudomonas sp. M30-35 TaxID=1981174 RepID=UPI000B3BF44E|nr:bifunctional biotin--[acetyl-CoA-carboxylase] ligase/biotin operon repressor BirA [Pseudomonas sp. M30-35]ARU87032.1 biotin--[acetyl-CoA-carboxylase] ligase [Pseudomonas sp. M30-35]
MQPLLRLLQDGRFHSGEALGEALGISRSAVWKQLQVLEAEFGLSIHKVRGRGYQLQNPLILLDQQRLSASHAAQGWPVTVLQSVDSTNAEVLRLLAAGESAPFVLLAEQQTAGRGRRGRTWVSPFAENMYYSLIIRIDGGMRQVEGLSLVVGLALLKAIEQLGISNAGLKWPNDVLVEGQKIAGILLEMSGDPGDVCHVVIGVGVNVNMKMVGADVITQAWTSLSNVLGRSVDRNQLVEFFSVHLQRYIDVHMRNGFAALQTEWQDNHLWQGRMATLTAGQTPIKGEILGVDATGAIRLRVDGEERSFSGGELSLRLSDDS